METLILAAVVATVLWFAAFIGLMATAPAESAGEAAERAESAPHDPIGRSFVIATRSAILVGLGGWALYASAEIAALLV